MLASKLYSPTSEIPADAEIASHQYMLKAGSFVKVVAVYTHSCLSGAASNSKSKPLSAKK